MLERKRETCSNCRFYSQEVDPEQRFYYDDRSGECRRNPPTNNFVWFRTRPTSWCGEWQPATEKDLRVWQRVSTHLKDAAPVLLYKRGAFCKQSGMMIGYWNARFSKWHDDADLLFEHDEFSHWIALPEPPEF